MQSKDKMTRRADSLQTVQRDGQQADACASKSNYKRYREDLHELIVRHFDSSFSPIKKPTPKEAAKRKGAA